MAEILKGALIILAMWMLMKIAMHLLGLHSVNAFVFFSRLWQKLKRK